MTPQHIEGIEQAAKVYGGSGMGWPEALDQLRTERDAARQEVSALIEQLDHMQVERDAALEELMDVNARLSKRNVELDAALERVKELETCPDCPGDGSTYVDMVECRCGGKTYAQLLTELQSAQAVIAACRRSENWPSLRRIRERRAALAAHLSRYPPKGVT